MKIVFDLAQKQVRIEGDGPELVGLFQMVREIAPNYPEITIVTDSAWAYASPSQATVADTISPSGGATRQTMKEFARSLAPANLAEKIACVGHYASRHDGRQTFSGKEMSEWFTLCGFEKPAQMAVALFDAKRKYGYIERVGHNDWRLTSQGDNVVIRKLEENRVDN